MIEVVAGARHLCRQRLLQIWAYRQDLPGGLPRAIVVMILFILGVASRNEAQLRAPGSAAEERPGTIMLVKAFHFVEFLEF